MTELQPIALSDLYYWAVKNNITAAATPADSTFKTPGFDIEVIKITGAFYNPSGAILPTQQTRDRILWQIVSGDTSAQIANQSVDIFAALDLWKDNTSVPKLILAKNTNYQVIFSIDTTTALGTYPIRCELQFVGKKSSAY